MKIPTLKNFVDVVQAVKGDPKKLEYKFMRLMESVSKLSYVFLKEANFKSEPYSKTEFISVLMEVEYMLLAIYSELATRNRTVFGFNVLTETLGNKVRFMREEYNSKQNKLNINMVYMKMMRSLGDLGNTFVVRDNKTDDKARFDAITNLISYLSFVLDLAMPLFKDEYPDKDSFEKYYTIIFDEFVQKYEIENQECLFVIENAATKVVADMLTKTAAKAPEVPEGTSGMVM